MDRGNDERRHRATSFADVAVAYERSRPGYPDDAVRWLVGEEPLDVVDLGAGTGKLTRSLVACGHRVTAVEPLPEMIAQLRVAVPRAIAVEGEAEAIPLADGSADVVVVAQAFHWFDQQVAVRECARVLRPGGRLALVWNVRDESEAWVADLSDAMVGRTGVDHAAGAIATSGLFEPEEHVTLGPHFQEVDRSTLRELVLSRSFCAALSEEERAPIFERVDGVFAEHERNGIVRLTYLVECFRAQRR
jgi:SAM-dependent methyltransferase